MLHKTKKFLIPKWFSDYKKALCLLKKIHHNTDHIRYTYPLPGKLLFSTLAGLSRNEILHLGINLKLSWTQIQDLLVFTGHEELHLRCKEDYEFVKEHL